MKGIRRAFPTLFALMAVLALVAEGLMNAQIAIRLSVSESTVKFHLQNIFEKLGVTNRTEAAAVYHRLARKQDQR